MTQIFTPNDLVRYIYQETEDDESLAIEKALLYNEELLDAYQQTLSMIAKLDRAITPPSENCVQNILNYSKSLNLHSV